MGSGSLRAFGPTVALWAATALSVAGCSTTVHPAARIASTPSSTTPAPSPTAAGEGPGCPITGPAAVVGRLHAAAGRPVVVRTRAELPARIRLTSFQLILGKPGSIAGAGARSGLPANAGLRPDQQAAATTLVTARPGQQVSVTAPSLTAGVYPVFVAVAYADPGVPCDGGGAEIGLMGRIGVVVVT